MGSARVKGPGFKFYGLRFRVLRFRVLQCTVYD
jgi:hypothetical protein